MASRGGYWPRLHNDLNFGYRFVEAFGTNEELVSLKREGPKHGYRIMTVMFSSSIQIA